VLLLVVYDEETTGKVERMNSKVETSEATRLVYMGDAGVCNTYSVFFPDTHLFRDH
jgi:hypothetical protein